MLRACLLWDLLCTGLCKENIFILSLREYQPTLAMFLVPTGLCAAVPGRPGVCWGTLWTDRRKQQAGVRRRDVAFFGELLVVAPLPSQPVVKSLKHPKC